MRPDQADTIIDLLQKILDRLPEPEPKRPPLTGEAALPRWSTTREPFGRENF